MQETFRKSRILYTGETPKKRNKKYFPKKPFFVVLAVIFFVSVIVGAFYVLRLPRMRIQEIRIEGVKSVSEDDIRSLVSRELEGNILYFIPRDNYLFASSSRIAGLLKGKFLRIADVKAHKTLDSVLVIEVAERDIWGIGCVKTVVEEVKAQGAPKAAEVARKNGPCFYIDTTGFAFEDVSSFEGGLLPIIYKDVEGTLGSSIMQTADVDFFEEAAKVLQPSLHLSLLSAEFSSQNSEDVRLNLKEGWSLIVTRDKVPATWISVLKTLLTGDIKEKQLLLDYVDLRFGNKVFYKFR